ncbi:MAG: tRNA (N6-isopentenyl adenosine(37)-C2)-methylthiotransferase MiaB [Bacillota bacterium]|nr:tRNA (N6-isopentenyl adenosine(37)-C2)-methylthiotransferase MiaB [Bacillota bacterium]
MKPEQSANSYAIGEGKKYLLITFGCQMNEHDSEVICSVLESLGYSAVLTAEEADLIVINTCAVRQKPEDKVTSLLGKYYALKQENKELIIAVGGCMTQQEEAARYIRDRFHHVNIVFGTHALPRLPLLLEAAINYKGTIIDIDEDYTGREELTAAHSSTFKAWLPVIYGCNNFCSYCVVPHVRGRERSRHGEDILKEAKSLAARGYLELTLLGQNVNSYGQDLAGDYTFAGLLRDMNYVEGLKRIRFMTSHPKDLSPELIEAVRSGDSICEHFHLPVQSGSNRILKNMNRGYSREHYIKLVNMIKDSIPGVSITSDIIVGFPGESEEDFQATLDLLKTVRFDNAFSFIYSPRKNTTAAAMREQLSHGEKEERLQRLNEVQHAISSELNLQLEGSTVEVLVEGPSKNNIDMQTGRTRTNKLVHFPGSSDLTGKLVNINISEAKTWNLAGVLEGENS